MKRLLNLVFLCNTFDRLPQVLALTKCVGRPLENPFAQEGVNVYVDSANVIEDTTELNLFLGAIANATTLAARASG